jgi:hypothetical protein
MKEFEFAAERRGQMATEFRQLRRRATFRQPRRWLAFAIRLDLSNEPVGVANGTLFPIIRAGLEAADCHEVDDDRRVVVRSHRGVDAGIIDKT